MTIGLISDQSYRRWLGVSLDALTHEDFAKIEGQLKGARMHVLYDSLRLVPGAWKKDVNYLFSVPQRQATRCANDRRGNIYYKTQIDTNIHEAGHLEAGSAFAIKQMTVGIQPKIAIPQHHAIDEAVTASLIIGDRRWETGKLAHWPSNTRERQIWNRAIQIAQTEGSAELIETLMFARDLYSIPSDSLNLAKPRHVQNGKNYGVTITNENVQIDAPCVIYVSLHGVLYKPTIPAKPTE